MSFDPARNHVARTGHQLKYRGGPRPWSKITLYCVECEERWYHPISDHEDWPMLLIELNKTERKVRTVWERLNEDKFPV